jgi:alanine racemase
VLGARPGTEGLAGALGAPPFIRTAFNQMWSLLGRDRRGLRSTLPTRVAGKRLRKARWRPKKSFLPHQLSSSSRQLQSVLHMTTNKTVAPAFFVDYAPNRFVVDLGAIAYNAREIRHLIGRDCFFFAALKGNAYGHGLVEAGRAALQGGADGLSMVHLRDAITLRRAGVEAPILLYGGSLGHPDSVELVENFDLMATVVDSDSIELHARGARKQIKTFLKIDVGLERLGCAPKDAVELAKEIDASPRLSLQGVYTHMNADGQYAGLPLIPGAEVHPFITWQFKRFRRALHNLEAAGIRPPVTLAASSPVIRLSPDMNLTGIDVGRLLYGLIPLVPPNVELDLRPAFHSLTSRLLQVKSVHRTEFVQWADFEVRKGMRIGVIPMGYGDGLAVLTTDEVLVRGRRVPVIGKHFEHARLDLTDVPDARGGDEVVVIGRQGGEEITPEQVAKHQNFAKAAGLASLVRESIPKVYLSNDIVLP